MSKKKIYNVLIYGCGNIGYRHLQAILKLNLSVSICLYDINIKKYAEYKKQILKDNLNLNSKSIYYLNDIKNYYFDLFICSSLAKNRYDQIRYVILNNSVRNILIEKIPFQKVTEYKKINKLFKIKTIKAWVNCPNRTFNSYKNLKNILKNKDFNMKVSGSNWNLLSNSIHYIDLFNYLKKSNIIQINNNLNKPVNSKRKGFKEAHGGIDFIFSKKNYLKLESYNNKNIPIKIEIFSKNIYLIIFEQHNQMYFQNMNNKIIYSLKDFQIEYQSNLTNKIYYNILINQKCSLIEFSESINYLEPFLKNLKKYFKKFNYNNIPIT